MKQIQKVAPFAAMAVGAVLALATSAFKTTPKLPAGSFFYEFVGDQTLQSDVQDRTKYQRVDAGCSETDGDLCGIFLPTDAAPNANPSAVDFTPHEGDLWTSAQNGSSADDLIEMKSE